MAQSSSQFTLQLVSVSSSERRDAYLELQRHPEDFAWYSVQRGERTLYVITYGLFDSLDDAQLMAKSLPPEVGPLEPWVRQLKFVQDAIDSNR